MDKQACSNLVSVDINNSTETDYHSLSASDKYVSHLVSSNSVDLIAGGNSW